MRGTRPAGVGRETEGAEGLHFSLSHHPAHLSCTDTDTPNHTQTTHPFPDSYLRPHTCAHTKKHHTHIYTPTRPPTHDNTHVNTQTHTSTQCAQIRTHMQTQRQVPWFSSRPLDTFWEAAPCLAQGPHPACSTAQIPRLWCSRGKFKSGCRGDNRVVL